MDLQCKVVILSLSVSPSVTQTHTPGCRSCGCVQAHRPTRGGWTAVPWSGSPSPGSGSPAVGLRTPLSLGAVPGEPETLPACFNTGVQRTGTHGPAVLYTRFQDIQTVPRMREINVTSDTEATDQWRHCCIPTSQHPPNIYLHRINKRNLCFNVLTIIVMPYWSVFSSSTPQRSHR